MSPERTIGWDLGGAHLKAACVDAEGYVLGAAQIACPLWRGLDHLRHGVDRALAALPSDASRHAVTMTGEMVDLFANRTEGVRTLVRVVGARLGPAPVHWYAGPLGFRPGADALDDTRALASCNWLASASFVAGRVPDALFIDIGSTTTDIVPIRAGAVRAHGGTDNARLRRGELLYTGVVRTPLMAVTTGAPFKGDWIPLMAEHFAVTADVYRLTGELPAHADLHATADAGPKTPPASARRLARMLGLDREDGTAPDWRRLAAYLRDEQLHAIGRAAQRVQSDVLCDLDAPLVGCGVGRFLVRRLAARWQRPYIDVGTLLKLDRLACGDPVDCLPAVAVAELAGAGR